MAFMHKKRREDRNQELDFLWLSVGYLCRESIEALYQVAMAIPDRHEPLRRCLVALASERLSIIETCRRSICTDLFEPTMLTSFVQNAARNYQELSRAAVESQQGLPALSNLILVDRVSLSYFRNAVRRLPLNAGTLRIADVLTSLQINNDRIKDRSASCLG